MDINDLRVLTTVLSLILFLAIAAWAWSGRRRSSFEAAAQLPFLDGDAAPSSAGEQR